MNFVVKCRYRSCRAGNDLDELDLARDRIDARAIASFGAKGPDRMRIRIKASNRPPRADVDAPWFVRGWMRAVSAIT